MPESWKIALLQPIPKKDDRSKIENYRGIALQNVVLKILDILYTRKLSLNAEKFLSNRQQGFRPKRGTTSCLLELAQYVHEGISSSTRVDAVFIDFEKAFDRILHSTIVKKLAKMGMPLDATLFTVCMITNRAFIVIIDGEASATSFMPKSSVPQGSHCGPTLFIMTTNDMPDHIIHESFILQYADDVVLCRAIKTAHDCQSLQKDIDKLVEWSDAARMRINPAKTKVIHFHKSHCTYLTGYTLSGSPIERQTTHTYLGLLLDEKMSFIPHARSIAARATKLAMQAGRLAHYVGRRHINITLYNVYIEPIILYAAPVWLHLSKTHTDDVYRAHRIATKLALNAPWRPHIEGYLPYEERCRKLNVPTVAQRSLAATCNLGVKIISGLTPSNLRPALEEAIYVARDNHRGAIPLFFRDTSKTPLAYIKRKLESLGLNDTFFNENPHAMLNCISHKVYM